jgi:K+/H+ antiporter YhaU regulatory subunit KhtT
MKSNKSTPTYRNIAVDIANKIVKGELRVREKISGRSTLASMYNVSPETIRRALALLEDMNVVVSNLGSGVEIISVSSAEKFIEKYKNSDYLKTVKEDILKIMEKRKELDEELELNFIKILDLVERFSNITPFTLIEVSIEEQCKFLGRRVTEVKFWQFTGATIVAIRRNKDITISPGPDYTFNTGDTLVVIGSTDVYDKVWNFLYKDEEFKENI